MTAAPAQREPSRWRRGPAVLHRRTADGPLVLSPESDEPTLLAGTAAAVWLLLDEPRDESALLARLSAAASSERPDVTSSESSTQAIDALARTLPALDGAGIIEAVW